MSYINDTKPSGSYTDDANAVPDAFYGSAKYGYSKYGTTSIVRDTKPSGSYVNDAKPS